MLEKRQVLTVGSVTLVASLALLPAFNVTSWWWNPLQKIWEAIYDLQTEVDSLNASLLEAQSDIATLENKLLEVQSKVEDLETRIPKKGYVSVSAAAFVPGAHFYEYYSYGYSLYNWGTSNQFFYAAVQLPHGAKVTNFTSYWFDDNATDIHCILWRWCPVPPVTLQDMARADSTGDSGPGFSYDDTIDFATVDNAHFSYFVRLTIPPNLDYPPNVDYFFTNAIIEYEYQR